jgi:hypothetical protein
MLSLNTKSVTINTDYVIKTIKEHNIVNRFKTLNI